MLVGLVRLDLREPVKNKCLNMQARHGRVDRKHVGVFVECLQGFRAILPVFVQAPLDHFVAVVVAILLLSAFAQTLPAQVLRSIEVERQDVPYPTRHHHLLELPDLARASRSIEDQTAVEVDDLQPRTDVSHDGLVRNPLAGRHDRGDPAGLLVSNPRLLDEHAEVIPCANELIP